MTNEKNGEIKDAILQVFLGMADTGGLEMGVTLSMSGTVISGVLINRENFMIGVENDFKSSGNEWGIMLANSLETARLSAKEEENEKEVEIEENLEDYEFIHLKDAKIVSGIGLIPNNRGVYWRGKVDSVDGFSIGNITQGNN